MKRIIFCFDGTTNTLSAEHPTNVVLMAESIKATASDDTPQLVYYDEGVGTGKLDRIRGTLFGVGLVDNIEEAYRFLIFNHEPDDEIFIFGYSRGAYTARSFAGFIRHVGVLDSDNAKQIEKALNLYKAAMSDDGDDHIEALRFRARYSKKICVSDYDEDWRNEYVDGYEKGQSAKLNIKYVGVWDTVGALGVPNILPFAAWLNRKKGFHDVRLTSKVGSARHALALDEKRKLFRPTIWGNINELNTDKSFSSYDIKAPYQQKWFPGVHGSVGGGGPLRGLSDNALSWVITGARRAGLEVNVDEASRIYKLKPNFSEALHNNPKKPFYKRNILGLIYRFFFHDDREGPQDIKDISASVLKRWLTNAEDLPEKIQYRPLSLYLIFDDMVKVSEMIDNFDNPALQTKMLSTHTVIKGDTLQKISKRYLGSVDHVENIYDLNRDLIDDPDEIHIGWQIRIPKK